MQGKVELSVFAPRRGKCALAAWRHVPVFQFLVSQDAYHDKNGNGAAAECCSGNGKLNERYKQAGTTGEGRVGLLEGAVYVQVQAHCAVARSQEHTLSPEGANKIIQCLRSVSLRPAPGDGRRLSLKL